MSLAAVGAGRLANRRAAAVVGGAGGKAGGGDGSTAGPGDRKFPQGAMSEEYAIKVAKEALRQSEWLRELRAIKGINDTKAQYEAISTFIRKYERGTGIKIEGGAGRESTEVRSHWRELGDVRRERGEDLSA
jgi:hypothetical protein